jgi:hypothetical protein
MPALPSFREGTVACIDADLHPPESWASGEKRLKKAGIPEGVGYRPNWQIALEMIQRAQDGGLRGPVLADAAYGTVTKFRRPSGSSHGVRVLNRPCGAASPSGGFTTPIARVRALSRRKPAG